MNPNYIIIKKLRIPELKALCKENHIKGFSKLRKIQLVDLLFKNLHPQEQKVLKEELKEPSPKPEIVLKKESLPEIIEPINSLEVKVDLFPQEKVEQIEEPTEVKKPIKKTQEQFDDEYLALLKEKMEQIKIKNEKKKNKKEKIKRQNFLDLDDKDVIATINALIRKIYK